MSQAAKVFTFIAQALETDALTGQSAKKVVDATKVLLAESNLNAAPLLQQFSPESQQAINAYFA